MSESSGPSRAYCAFISYSHRDKAWGDWLHKVLETYRVPSRLVGTTTAHGMIPRRLNPIFRDREELASAAELGRKVNEALAQSENLVVICSPASATSRWVNEEVLAYKRMGRAGRIFCLIVDGEPNATDIPGREAEECFCPALRFQLDAHGQPTSERTEPIAADARPGRDGKSNAKLKLIAGMLDVGFDALKQREQHRRMRRMTAITALAVCVMAVTIVLAIFALVSRHRAVIAQHKAVVAQQSAERRQKQAEDLVNFMLGDLSTKLRHVDRLDILGAVDDKAMAYFKALPSTDINDTELEQRARALQKIGEVRMDRSRLSDAMVAFQQALRLNTRLARASPNDPARQNAYGENLLWVGFDDWYQGKLDRSEASFRKAAAALEHAAALAPADADIQQNLDSIYDDLGHVAEARGELDAAHGQYRKELALCLRMSKARPDDAQWQNDLGDAYSNLGGVSLARGRLADAVSADLDDRRVIAAAVAKNPKDRRLLGQLQVSEAVLGRTLALAGQVRSGLDQVRSAVKIGSGLVAFDPTHYDWQDSYFYYELLLGRLLWNQGEIDAAGKPIESSVAGLQKLLARDAKDAEWRSNLAEAQLEQARLARARGHRATAVASANQAQATLHTLLVGDSPKTSNIRIEAGIELVLGQLAADAGNATAAMKHRQAALRAMQPLATNSRDPRDLSLWVEALLATGNRSRALPAIQALQTMGYRPDGFVTLLRSYAIAYPENVASAQRIAHIVGTIATDPIARTRRP